MRTLLLRARRDYVAATLVALIGTVMAPETFAQSPAALANVTGNPEQAAQGIAANNPWFGVQVVHRFGESDDFSSNLLTAGQFVYDIDMGASKVHLPVISNFGGKIAAAEDPTDLAEGIKDQLKELLQSTAGITAGLFPYVQVVEKPVFMLTLHGMAAWKYNGLKPYGEATTVAAADDAEIVHLHQGKFGVGAEVILGKRDDGPAVATASISPVWLVMGKDAYKRAFGEEQSRIFAIELLGILPIRKGLGLVFEGVLGQDSNRAFRAGLMLAAQP